LRFDFSHPKPLSEAEIRKVEEWVNSRIARAVPRVTQVMEIEDAKAGGAVALFGEKYGDKVRVVTMGESVELCGGTHIENTAQIGLFLITKESGVSAGVRRIEAICGTTAVNFINGLRDELNSIKIELKNQNPMAGIQRLKDEINTLKGELKTALNSTKKELNTREINGLKVIIDEVSVGDIKELIDEAKNRYPQVAIMLFQRKGNKVLIASGSKDSPIQAGDWIREIAPILGGGGGGRPDFAQAGGKDISKIEEAKREALKYVERVLTKK
jgi:alanyl-tRNA synthetase